MTDHKNHIYYEAVPGGEARRILDEYYRQADARATRLGKLCERLGSSEPGRWLTKRGKVVGLYFDAPPSDGWKKVPWCGNAYWPKNIKRNKTLLAELKGYRPPSNAGMAQELFGASLLHISYSMSIILGVGLVEIGDRVFVEFADTWHAQVYQDAAKERVGCWWPRGLRKTRGSVVLRLQEELERDGGAS